MVKVKVLIPFNDKHTGKLHKKDEVLDVTAKRFNEILSKVKYVQLVEDEPEKKESK